MSKAAIVAVALFFVSVWIVFAAAITAVWLTGEVRVVGAVTVPSAVIASLLILYFDWRARLVSRIASTQPEAVGDERQAMRRAA